MSQLAFILLTGILSTAFAQYSGYGGSYSSASYGTGAQGNGNPSSNNTDNNGLTGTVVAGNGNNTAVCAPIAQVFNLTGDDLFKTILIYLNTFNTEAHNISQANPGDSAAGTYLSKIKAFDAVVNASGLLALSANASAAQCVAFSQTILATFPDVENAANDTINGNCSSLTGDDYYHHIYQQTGAALLAVGAVARNATNISNPNPGQWLTFIINYIKTFSNYATVVRGANAQQGCNDAASQFNTLFQQAIQLGDQLKTGAATRSKQSMLHNSV